MATHGVGITLLQEANIVYDASTHVRKFKGTGMITFY